MFPNEKKSAPVSHQRVMNLGSKFSPMMPAIGWLYFWMVKHPTKMGSLCYNGITTWGLWEKHRCCSGFRGSCFQCCWVQEFLQKFWPKNQQPTCSDWWTAEQLGFTDPHATKSMKPYVIQMPTFSWKHTSQLWRWTLYDFIWYICRVKKPKP